MGADTVLSFTAGATYLPHSPRTLPATRAVLAHQRMHIGTDITGAQYAISNDERRRHLYITGATGTGKSTLLRSMMLQDLAADRPFALLDPHGDLAVSVTDNVPKDLTRRVLYFDPLDPTHAVGYNPLANVPFDRRSQVTASTVAGFHHIWYETWGPRMAYILGHAIRLLLDNNETLLSLPVLLIDDQYRRKLLERSTDPYNRAFWEREYAQYDKRFRMEAIAPIQNKIGALTGNYHVRSVLGQKGALNVSYCLNHHRYLIANLSKAMGEEPSHLLGAFITSTFAQAAMDRIAVPEEERTDFTLYVDEFQNFTTSAFETILSEARKYRLNLVLANQFPSQLPERTMQAVIGNVSTMIVFRVAHQDAKLFAEELDLANPATLASTPNYRAWVRGMQPASPVQVYTERPAPALGRFKAVQAHTRANYAVPRDLIDSRVRVLVENP